MYIRRAENKDIGNIKALLGQVLEIHHKGRPDLFKGGCTKYTDSELSDILSNPLRSVFVADCDGKVMGYAFCEIIEHKNHNILTDIKTLYIDDLCVDENARGKHIGKTLYEAVLKYAREINCYNVTLNVWSCNTDALAFYEKLELKPQKTGMEFILK